MLLRVDTPDVCTTWDLEGTLSHSWVCVDTGKVFLWNPDRNRYRLHGEAKLHLCVARSTVWSLSDLIGIGSPLAH
jgi:hypothetical protein